MQQTINLISLSYYIHPCITWVLSRSEKTRSSRITNSILYPCKRDEKIFRYTKYGSQGALIEKQRK